MNGQSSYTASEDRVLLLTRVLSAGIVPFLVAAFIILFFKPGESGRLFAWPVRPSMTAMMLGVTYLGGAYFFGAAAIIRQWHRIRLGFLPVTAFAATLGISTLIHLDRFSHGQLAFQLWALLYWTLPFVIPIAWYRNQQAVGAAAPGSEPIFPSPLRLAIGGMGAVMSVVSAILFLVPGLIIPTWPWSLTPLTARVMAAMFALSGMVGLGVAIDGRWSSAKIPFTSQVISIILILVSMLRAREEIAWTRLESWFFIVGLTAVLTLIGWAAIEAKRLRGRDQLEDKT